MSGIWLPDGEDEHGDSWLPKSFNGLKYLENALAKSTFPEVQNAVLHDDGDGNYIATITCKGRASRLRIGLMEGNDRGKNKTWAYTIILELYGGPIDEKFGFDYRGSVRNRKRLPALLKRVVAFTDKWLSADVPTLISWLEHPDSTVRRKAASILSRLGWIPTTGKDTATYIIAREDFDSPLLCPDVAPFLVEKLRSAEGRDILLIARALARIKGIDDATFAEFISLIRDIYRRGNTEFAGKIVNVLPTSFLLDIKGEEWVGIIGSIPSLRDALGQDPNWLSKELPPTLNFFMLSDSVDEKNALAISIKQEEYRASQETLGTASILPEYPVTQENLRHYLGIYNLPWNTFRAAIERFGYENFHRQPGKYTDAHLDETEVRDVRGPAAPPDSSPGIAMKVLRDISSPEELAKCLRSEALSAAFDRKLVLAFDDDLGLYQQENPLRRVMEALKELKKKPEYKRILANLEIVHGPAATLGSRVNGFMSAGNARVFLFSRDTTEAKRAIGTVAEGVSAVYIDEAKFKQRAYYPLAEIVAITLAHHFDNIIPAGEIHTALSLGDKNLELASINIESIRLEGGAIIVKLLPKAREHETGELVKRYAAVLPFLEAA